MSANDEYASREAKRRRAYQAAYQSEEAKAWVNSLSPTQRAEAGRLGLLDPCLDGSASGAASVENLPPSMEPFTEDAEFDKDVVAVPFRKPEQPEDNGWGALLTALTSTHRKMLLAFLHEEGDPRLRWACLCYLLSEGTCEDIAHQVGMTKQAFHYHVRKIQKRFDLPPMGNQKGEQARIAYSVFNNRIISVFDTLRFS